MSIFNLPKPFDNLGVGERMIKISKDLQIDENKIAMRRISPSGILQVTLNPLARPNRFNHPDDIWLDVTEKEAIEYLRFK